MPVWFRTGEEARRALWLDSGDPRLPDILRRLHAFTRRLAPNRPIPPRGVRRFRSIEEAALDRKRRAV